MNLPNKLTLIRIALIPLFIACFYIDLPTWYVFATTIFLVAYFTDMLDGYIARTFNMITDFGKLMDPIADKLLTASALIMLTARGMLDPIPTIIIVAREFIISGFRLVSVQSGVVIPASWLGKAKTASQVVALTLCLVQRPLYDWLGFPLDVWALWISVLFTVVSGADYIIRHKDLISYK